MSPCSGKVVKDTSFVRKTGRRETNPHRNSVERDHRVCKGPWSIFFGGGSENDLSGYLGLRKSPEKGKETPLCEGLVFPTSVALWNDTSVVRFVK
jgi:hypothetical protein